MNGLVQGVIGEFEGEPFGGEAGVPVEVTEEGGDESPIVRAKWTIDGAATLAEAATRAREFADYLQGLHDQGWVLDQPIADDYGFLSKP